MGGNPVSRVLCRMCACVCACAHVYSSVCVWDVVCVRENNYQEQQNQPLLKPRGAVQTSRLDQSNELIDGPLH